MNILLRCCKSTHTKRGQVCDVWLTLNQGLLVGTWLQLMGIPPYCKVCDSRVEESPQHCLSSAPWCNALGKLIREFVKTGKCLRISPSPGHSSYSGSLSPNERTTLSGSLHIMPAASLTLGNLLTFFVASSSTFTGLRGAEGTSVTNTLSKKSSFRHGWPPLKLVWPLGKPLDLTAPPRTPTSNLESS